MTPVQMLACMRSKPDASITVFHKSRNRVGHNTSLLTGSAMIGCTLNYREEFYAGWAPQVETVSIYCNLVDVDRLKHLLTSEDWKAPGFDAGGTIYRLRDEYHSPPRPPCKTYEEVLTRQKECEILIAIGDASRRVS
ncbi:hypothetical protein [Erwinia sp. V71]|uniref:hypothetical protein n=1 Tax=Erwinia sp. V71 TaxID=3369424 RepID=UPI003F636C6B